MHFCTPAIDAAVPDTFDFTVFTVNVQQLCDVEFFVRALVTRATRQRNLTKTCGVPRS